MAGSIIGAAVKRVEDPQFLRGEGTYVSNMEMEDALHLAVVRSEVPHGRILEIDTADAINMAGVVGIYTADTPSSCRSTHPATTSSPPDSADRFLPKSSCDSSATSSSPWLPKPLNRLSTRPRRLGRLRSPALGGNRRRRPRGWGTSRVARRRIEPVGQHAGRTHSAAIRRCRPDPQTPVL